MVIYLLCFCFCSAGNETLPVQPVEGSDSESFSISRESSVPSDAASQGSVGPGLRERILAVDRKTFLLQMMERQHGSVIAQAIVAGRRDSTLAQQEISWRAFQSWLEADESREVDKTNLLEFCLYLRNSKGLAPSTIANYRAALARPLGLAAGINFDDFEFKDLDKYFFLSGPSYKKRIPRWSLEKVLQLLGSNPKYLSATAKPRDLLRKLAFLLALATGNRVSELSAIDVSAMREDTEGTLSLPVDKSFRFKNERVNRTPPEIEVKSLPEDCVEICPVATLKTFVARMGLESGKLFINTKTKSPLRPASLSLLICNAIDEADPGCFPRAHDVRKAAASLAWARGLSLQEITRRCFWKDVSTFVRTYLFPMEGPGLALNTS